MKHFQKITEILSGETYSTLNMACVFRSEIASLLEPNRNDVREIADLKENMRKKFEHRFPMSERMVVAALLDPRFQNLLDVTIYLRDHNTTAFDLLKDWASDCLPAVTASTTAKNRDKDQNLIEELIERHSTLSSVRQNLNNDSDISREVHLLLSMGGNVTVNKIRLFWKDNRVQMPILSNLARKVLPVPVTSTPSERNFSTAGLIANSRKCNLLPGNLDRILFIHNNYEFCKDIVFDNFEMTE